MQITQQTTRSIALLAGGVMAVSSLHPAPARADKSSSYKAGAIGLGVAAGALILKGKTLPGVLAGVGAYYAYKKSQDAKPNHNYAQYPDNRNNGNYPVDNGGYANGGYSNGEYNNGGNYNNGGYGQDANAGYDYNGDNRNGATYNQGGNGYNRPDDNGNYQGDGGYLPADNQPTYNDGGNYPTQQTYGQTTDQGYQQTENSDVTDYNQRATSQAYGNEPNYGYRAFSQARSAHASRHNQKH